MRRETKSDTLGGSGQQCRFLATLLLEAVAFPTLGFHGGLLLEAVWQLLGCPEVMTFWWDKTMCPLIPHASDKRPL